MCKASSLRSQQWEHLEQSSLPSSGSLLQSVVRQLLYLLVGQPLRERALSLHTGAAMHQQTCSEQMQRRRRSQ